MKIKCINNKNCEHFLTAGNIYEVFKENIITYYIKTDKNNKDNFYKHRFVIVEESIENNENNFSQFETLVLREALKVVQQHYKDKAIEEIDENELDEAKNFLKKLEITQTLLNKI